MKNWQFWTLLIVQILGFAIIIAIIQGTNSLVPTIIDTHQNTENISTYVEAIDNTVNRIEINSLR